MSNFGRESSHTRRFAAEGKGAMKIAVGSDHAAYDFKVAIVDWLRRAGREVFDFGSSSREPVDYCDYGFMVARVVAGGEFDRGLLFCGTGVGISICANKVNGVRAVVCSEPYSAQLSRAHNDTNILALGARVVAVEMGKMIIDTWLDTAFVGGRHAERIGKIKEFEQHQYAGNRP
jgi:ribose 5-phosphate isomerase B